MAKVLASFVPVKIDLTDRSATTPQAAVAMKYGVRYLPDLRVLSPDGAELGTIDAEDVNDLAVQLGKHA